MLLWSAETYSCPVLRYDIYSATTTTSTPHHTTPHRTLIYAYNQISIHLYVPMYVSEIALAKPSAELRPIEAKEGGNDDDDDGDRQEYSQLDEDEMGMTYQELGRI